MSYSIQSTSTAKTSATIHIKNSNFQFGTTAETSETLASPAELFLGAFSACMLKNVERFSEFMHFTYEKAEVNVTGTRQEKPPRMDKIHYELRIYSQDQNLNLELLKRNIEKFGTIYNTVKLSCEIEGGIVQINE